MYNLVMKSNGKVKETFKTESDAQNALEALGRTKNFYRIEAVPEPTSSSSSSSKTDWKKEVDFTGAVEINRENNKLYYNKSGYINVIETKTGKSVHVGRTRNMGKVFSNYVNCAHYNQSYDFNFDAGEHKVMFKESNID